MNSDSKIQFHKILIENLPGITEAQIDLLAQYESLLSEWNKKINLVSRKDEENIWSRHIIGSIAFLFQFDLCPKSDIIDIGTGGGLPGIPLAILYPDSRFMLVDSIQKKITAVDDIVEALRLKNVQTSWSRAEELSREREFQGSFDYIISRAVAPLKEIVKWSNPFLRPHEGTLVHENKGLRIVEKGSFLFLKGGDLTDEIASAKVKFKPREIHNFELPLIEEIPELTDKRLILLKP